MKGGIMGQGRRVLATGLVGLCFLLLSSGGAWSEEPGAGGSCVARVDVWQAGSKKTSFSRMFSYKARVRPNTRECSVVDWQLSWDYRRKDNGRLEKDAMLLATTVGRGEGNATEEGEVQEDTNDTELNFRAENVSCRLCDGTSTRNKQGQPSRESSGAVPDEKRGSRYPNQRLCGITDAGQQCPPIACNCNDGTKSTSRLAGIEDKCCFSPEQTCEYVCSGRWDGENHGGWSGKFADP